MKASYPTPTLLPPSPSRVSPHRLLLPESDEKLVTMCLWIDKYLDELWSDYLTYCEFVPKPEATKIFAIIFAEMDFFEIIKGRIIAKISSKALTKDINKDVL